MPFVIKGLSLQFKDKDKRSLAISAGAVILLVLDIAFVFFPLIGKNFNLRAQIISVRADISSLKRQLSTTDELEQRLEILKAERMAYERRFPKEEEVPVLLGAISTSAGKSGVEIIAVKPVKLQSGEGETEDNSLFHEVPVEISAKAGYHQIGQFINSLELMEKFIEIKDVEIIQDKATPRRHYFRLLASMYILKG